MSILFLFLPTTSMPIYPVDNKAGFFWIDTVFKLWDTISNVPSYDKLFIELFGRLAQDQIHYGKVKLTSVQISKIFSTCIKNIEMPVANHHRLIKINQNSIAGFSNNQSTSFFSQFIIYAFEENDVKQQFMNLMFSLETFTHPSNFGGWTLKISSFVNSLASDLVTRIDLGTIIITLETKTTKIPKQCNLSNENLNLIIDRLLHLALILMFSKDSVVINL
jgi:proteasome activator subunit 4